MDYLTIYFGSECTIQTKDLTFSPNTSEAVHVYPSIHCIVLHNSDRTCTSQAFLGLEPREHRVSNASVLGINQGFFQLRKILGKFMDVDDVSVSGLFWGKHVGQCSDTSDISVIVQKGSGIAEQALYHRVSACSRLARTRSEPF